MTHDTVILAVSCLFVWCEAIHEGKESRPEGVKLTTRSFLPPHNLIQPLTYFFCLGYCISTFVITFRKDDQVIDRLTADAWD